MPCFLLLIVKQEKYAAKQNYKFRIKNQRNDIGISLNIVVCQKKPQQ